MCLVPAEWHSNGSEVCSFTSFGSHVRSILPYIRNRVILDIITLPIYAIERSTLSLPSPFDLLLGHIMQIGAQQLGALDVVPPVELLVDGMRGVGGAAHGEQEDVFAGGLLEGDGYGDAVSFIRMR